MCLIAFAWRSHPVYDLVFAANRDEFHTRSADAAHTWPDAPQVLAGRDRTAGGTWCGVTSDGRFAAVTNVREPDPPANGNRSRGALVGDYLAGSEPARRYCEAVRPARHAFGGFNLLVGDHEDLFYLGNRDQRGIIGVPPGIHALSNGVLGDAWPKTDRAEAGLRTAIAEPDVDPERLLALLADDTPAETGLPDTGIGESMEYFLSPVFIRGLRYGTRASTVILRAVDGSLRFIEQTYGPDGVAAGRVDRQWQIPPT